MRCCQRRVEFVYGFVGKLSAFRLRALHGGDRLRRPNREIPPNRENQLSRERSPLKSGSDR